VALARTCPLCGGTRARAVWHEHDGRYVRCSRCGVVFSDIDAAGYGAAGRNAWHQAELDSGTEAFYGIARERAHERFLNRFPRTGGGRLLDVGCGLGYFVSRGLAAGWDAYGCDTSEPWVARAQKLAGAERIALGELRPGLFGGSFDLVTAWDVLEHIHDPVPFLRSIRSLLGPSGRAFIRTPNLTWIYPTYALRRGILGSGVTLGPLNHVVYYTARTLGAALRRADLEPVAWPVLPPPQVGIGNRDPSRAGRAGPATLIKNLHAAAADRTARATRRRLIAGQDLDVVALPTGVSRVGDRV
jgi:2-polyprenyl-3-methyl-5-hydroxy-6-metoxy-1,4-benzoquinol methylase